MKKLVIILSALFLLTLPNQAQKNKKTETTTYSVNIDCQHCIDAITKDLAFVKGVKDLQFSLEEKTVAVTYRADKINKDIIAERIRNLDYKVEEINREK